MNEIKYKAWHFETKTIRPVYFILFSGQTISVLCKGDDSWYQNDEFALLQYTGLCDVDGKEIYDGDVLLVASVYDRGDGTFDDAIAVVGRDYDGAWSVTSNKQDRWSDNLFTVHSESKVIGNSWLNPELMNTNKQ